jgi:hypothetical protein
MVPAALIAPCIVWWNAWFEWGDNWRLWAMVPLFLAFIALIAAAVNLWLYVQSRWADLWADVQVTRNSTPEVRMFEAAKGMHPEAVKALLVHRRTIWRIKYIPLKDTVDWVLDEAPNVHGGFVDFVFDHSNGTLMPKRFLVEGSTKFDPDGLVTDYQQYDDLLLLMQNKLMCTQAYGNQAPHFLPPWNVDLLRHRFGMDGEGYQVDEGMSEAMRSVVKEQRVESREQKIEGLDTPMSTSATRPASDVIASALADLEQTSAMKAAAARVYNLKS